MPPLASRIVEKGLASDRVIIETVVAKYCDHLPLYRQEAILAREAGVENSRATLDGWVMWVGELLQPVVLAMCADGAAFQGFITGQKPAMGEGITHMVAALRAPGVRFRD